MHIVQVVQRYPPARGGSEAYFARLSRWLAARGHTVRVLTTTAKALTAFRDPRAETLPAGVTLEDGVTVERHALWHLPCQRAILRGLSLVPVRAWQGWVLSGNPLSWSMRQRVRTFEDPCAVVHATAFPYGWPLRCALHLARRCQVPFVLTPFLHPGDLDDPGNRVRRAFTHPALLAIAREADRLLVQTRQERDAFLNLGFPPARIVLQGLGVDATECTGGDRTGWRARLGIRPDEVVVGHLANLSAEKGSNDLVDAAEGKRFRIVLAGPRMPNFRCNPGVRVLGELSDGERRDFFAGIDLFALPSVVDSFGLVLLEAMANGVPCVGYNAGGIPGVIRHEVDGLIVPCRPAALAEALTRLSDDTDLRRRLGEAARTKALASTWDEKLLLAETALLDFGRSG